MDVLEAGAPSPESPATSRRIGRVFAVTAAVLITAAVGISGVRWWMGQSTRSDRLEILAIDPVGPFAISGEDLPEGWPEGLVAPALRLHVGIAGDPQRSTRVQAVGETIAYAAGGVAGEVIPAGDRGEIDLVVTPADCGALDRDDLPSPLVDQAGTSIPMTPNASAALALAVGSLCESGGTTSAFSAPAPRVDVFFRDRTLVMRIRVSTTADRLVMQPRDSAAFRGDGEVEATIEGGAATARLRWLVSPTEAAGLEAPTVSVRAFALAGGRAYPWVLDLRIPELPAASPAAPPRNDGVDLAEVAPRPSD